MDIERVRKEGTENSLYFRGLEELNCLPADVNNAPSRNRFKRGVSDIVGRAGWLIYMEKYVK